MGVKDLLRELDRQAASIGVDTAAHREEVRKLLREMALELDIRLDAHSRGKYHPSLDQ